MAVRVLFDATILGTDTRTRGIGRYVIDLALEMGRRASALGIELCFLTRVERTLATHLDDDAERAIARILDAPEIGFYEWAYRLRLGASLASRRAAANILHVPHTVATPLFEPHAVRLVTCHDLVPLRFPQHYVNYKDGFTVGRNLLDRRRARRADHIIAISEATASDLERLLAVPRDKMTVIYNGLDAARWPASADPRDAERVAALGIRGPYALYVGGADWRKNHDGMFRAVARTRHRGQPVELVWAGRLPDDTRARVELDRDRLDAPVRLVGYVDDPTLMALYRQAVATLFCSFAEGFGYPVLEAMALGSPVITSRCSSMPEVAGDAALLVDPHDPEAIASALLELAGDDLRRAELRRLGRARAETFTCARMASETLALYQRLAATRR